MSDVQDLDGASFNNDCKVLKGSADWLSNQKEPDIDQLVPKVETAMKAYAICKDRLDKVQATLGQYFEQDSAPSKDARSRNDEGNGQALKPIRPTPPAAEKDDHTPF